MIRLTIKNGIQEITERCDDCGCYVKNLQLDDILVKGNTDLIVKNSKGEEVTRKKLDRAKCQCENCK